MQRAGQRSPMLLAAIGLVLLVTGNKPAGATAATNWQNTFRAQPAHHNGVHFAHHPGGSSHARVHNRNGVVTPIFPLHPSVLSVPVQPHRVVHHAGRPIQPVPPAWNPRHRPVMMIGSPFGVLPQPIVVPGSTTTLAPSSGSTVGDISSRNSEGSTHADTPKPVNMSEVCSSWVSSTERQLMSYVTGFEAITGTIHELDEMMQQMRPASCELNPIAYPSNTSVSPQPFNASVVENVNFNAPTSLGVSEEVGRTEIAPVLDRVADVPINGPASEPSAISDRIEGVGENSGILSPTVEPFADPEPWNRSNSSANNGSRTNQSWPGSRSERDTVPRVDTLSASSPFGLPGNGANSAVSRDQISEDLSRASNDLKALRKDLSRTAEWLKQTNHTVHSALLRALLTYVSSIERRIDTERQAYAAQARSEFVKSRIFIIKEKIAALLEKLRSLIPSRILPINRDDSAHSTPVGRSTTPLPNLVAGSSTTTSSISVNSP